MLKRPSLSIPTNLFESSQFRAIREKHGLSFAKECHFVLVQMYDRSRQRLTDGFLRVREAQSLCEEASRRLHRRTYAALLEHGLTREERGTLCVAAYLDTNHSRDEIAAARSKRDGQQGAAFRRRMQGQRAQRATLTPPTYIEEVPHTLEGILHIVQKVPEQLQASSDSGSASLPKRERSEPHTAEKEATAVLSLEGARAKKAAKLAGEPPTKPKQGDLAAPPRVAVLAVVPNTGPPRGLHRAKRSAQRDNADTRKPSDAVISGDFATEAPMPSLLPTAVDIIRAAAAVWRDQPFPQVVARSAVQQEITFDELEKSLERISQRIIKGQNPGPKILLYVLGDLRKEAEQNLKGTFAPQSVRLQGGDKKRKAQRDAINAYIGRELGMHHCLETDLKGALDVAPDILVSLYTEMGAPDWKDVTQAYAAGRRPTTLGLLPPPPNKQIANAGRAALRAYVETHLDRVSATG